MNENIDLTKILKDVPKGTELWSVAYGTVRLLRVVSERPYPIEAETQRNNTVEFTSDGKCFNSYDDAECGLFPSKDQRDWRKFKYKPESKKVKVVLHPFDKVLVRNGKGYWSCDIFGNLSISNSYKYLCVGAYYEECIPYNKDTAHLLRTTDPCPIDYEIEFSKEYKEE